MCVCGFTCTCVQVEARDWHLVFSSMIPYLILWDNVSHWTLIPLIGTTGQQAPGIIFYLHSYCHSPLTSDFTFPYHPNLSNSRCAQQGWFHRQMVFVELLYGWENEGSLMRGFKIVTTKCFSPLSWLSWYESVACLLEMFPCFNLGFVAMIKHGPKPIWREKGLFHLILYGPSLRNSREIWMQELKQRSWGNSACFLSLVQLFFSYSPVLLAQGWHHPQWTMIYVN